MDFLTSSDRRSHLLNSGGPQASAPSRSEHPRLQNPMWRELSRIINNDKRTVRVLRWSRLPVSASHDINCIHNGFGSFQQWLYFPRRQSPCVKFLLTSAEQQRGSVTKTITGPHPPCIRVMGEVPAQNPKNTKRQCRQSKPWLWGGSGQSSGLFEVKTSNIFLDEDILSSTGAVVLESVTSVLKRRISCTLLLSTSQFHNQSSILTFQSLDLRQRYFYLCLKMIKHWKNNVCKVNKSMNKYINYYFLWTRS